MNKALAGLCCLLLAAIIAVPVATTADTSYTASIPGSIETPEQTIHIEGSSYTVDAIARTTQGEPLTVETNGPDNESYDVYLYKNDDGSQQIQAVKSVSAEDDGEVTFDTGELEAGSYVVVIDHDGTYYDPHPVVIPAYDVTVSGPETVQSTGSAEFSASVTETTGGQSVERVEIVVFNADTRKQLSTTKTDNSYTAELDLGSLSTGEYQVHAVAYSSEDAPREKNEVIGISDEMTLTVEASTQTPTTEGGAGGGAPGGGGGAGAPANGTTTTTSPRQSTTQSKVTTTAPDTSTSTRSAVTTAQPRSTTDMATTTQPALTTAGEASTPITPAPTQNNPTSTDGGAGETSLLLLALLAATALLVRQPNQ